MWPMAVVMVNEDANDLLEMQIIENQEPIQTFRANRPHEPFRDTVGVSSRLHRVRTVRHKPSGLPIPFIPYMTGRFR